MTGFHERGDFMDDWSKYKERVKATHPETLGRDLEDAETISRIVGAMVRRRRDMDLTQRDLAAMCGIPHSSVARIESGKTAPNLTTLLNLLRHLGLTLTVQPDKEQM